MSRMRTFALTLLAMLAFAGNSLFCRAAFNSSRIDAASFTSIRVAGGALVRWPIGGMRGGRDARAGRWGMAGGGWGWGTHGSEGGDERGQVGVVTDGAAVQDRLDVGVVREGVQWCSHVE